MLKYMMEGLKRLNILPVISKEVATHRGGSQLDQIFTNQQVLYQGVGSIDDEISDHFPLSVTIQLKKKDGEFTIYDKRVEVTQGAIRKAARSEGTINAMLLAQNVTNQEAKTLYQQHLTPSKVKRQWY